MQIFKSSQVYDKELIVVGPRMVQRIPVLTELEKHKGILMQLEVSEDKIFYIFNQFVWKQLYTFPQYVLTSTDCVRAILLDIYNHFN